MGPTFEFFGVETQLFMLSTVSLLGITAAALLYTRACSVLTSRGRAVPITQRLSYYFGLLLMVIATQTFIDPVGEQSLLSLHMLQHMLLADLPAPFLLYGVRAPVLYFFWPPAVLKRAARLTALRSFWTWLRNPPVALSVWLLTLYMWHIPFFYEAALTNRLVHDIEHISFALTGVLAWWPLMDPTHNRIEGRIWKAGYIVAARMVGGVLGILLVAWPGQLYGTYGDAALAYGISIRADQQAAGGIMMIVDSIIIMFAATYFLVTMERGEEYRSDLDNPVIAAAIARAAAEAEGTAVELVDAAGEQGAPEAHTQPETEQQPDPIPR